MRRDGWVRGWLRKVLIEPSDAITDPLVRRRARLLAVLLLLFAPLSVVMGAVSASFRPIPLGRIEWSLAGGIALLAATSYALSRTRFYHVAAGVFASLGLLAPWATSLVERAPHRVVASLVFGLAGVFYCGYFLSVRSTLIAAAALVALSAAVPVVHPLASGDALILPVFSVLVLVVLIVIGTISRHRDLAQIRQQSQQLRQIMEQDPDGVALVRGGALAYANPAMAAALAFDDASELVGRRLASLLRADDTEARARELLDSSTSGSREVAFVRRDGRAVVLEVSPVQPVRLDDQRALLLNCRDVTERKLLERQLLMSERMASLGTITAGIAHEVNNPLTYVLSNLEMLQEIWAEAEALGRLPAESKEILEDCLVGSEHIRDIVLDLKMFSRFDDEQRVAPVDLTQVLDSSINIVAHEIRHRAELVRTYGDTPKVLANDVRLGQVFINLLINAAQAIDNAGAGRDQRIAVRTATNEHGDAVVSISDTGAGIAPEDVEHIYEPFFTTRAGAGGTGLGLAICRKIVRSLDGDIQVESAAERGATFTVVLPAFHGGAGAAVAREEALEPAPAGDVLVIDDDERVAACLRRALNGHNVSVAHSCAEGLRLARETDFDAVICDVMMPDGSGVDYYEAVRRESPGREERIIFTTGGVFSAREQKFLAETENPCLDKPIRVADVRGWVDDYVRRARRV